MKQVHLLIAGFVQGIGFRQFIKHEARKRGVAGWVRNLPNGTVEALLQAKKPILDEMITFCKKGPMSTQVKDVAIEWQEAASQYSDFSIII